MGRCGAPFISAQSAFGPALGRGYHELGEKFEEKEEKLFGKDGFGTIVEEVAALEKALGIYDLAQFTPTR